MLVVDLAFKQEQRLREDLGRVEAFAAQLRGAAALHAAELQHAAHQTVQALRLRGDGLQIMGLLFIGDRPVQDPVGKAGDRGHGRFQLMGDIGDEIRAPLL